ncbi:MAG TPA: ABC transporter substrate-binding protein [Actinopolymorphaceae bacterium]|jgi:osmoprotectant transport system substrate-binding protein
MRSPRKTWVAVTTVTLALLLTITACGNSKGSDPLAAGTSAAPSAAAGTIVVGSASFPESTLIANIYMAALQAKGVKVSSKFAIGNREAYLPGLSDGSIDLIPEYTGNLLQSYDKSYTAETSDQVYSQLKTKLPSDLLVLDQSKAQDTDSVVVTKATATKYNLKSIADLAPVAGQLTLGGSAEWKTRPKSGIPALKSVYGVTFKNYITLDAGDKLSKNALKTGRVQATDIFSTDADITKNGWVVLADPKGMFSAQNVVPLINKAKATDTVTTALNAVSVKMTTAGLLALNAEVAGGKDPAVVAKEWLSTQGLI